MADIAGRWPAAGSRTVLEAGKTVTKTGVETPRKYGCTRQTTQSRRLTKRDESLITGTIQKVGTMPGPGRRGRASCYALRYPGFKGLRNRARTRRLR